MRTRTHAAFMAALLATVAPAAAQPCPTAACGLAFPKDAGAIDVRDFGAKGDGKTDDTAALLAAIAASGPDTGTNLFHDRIVYLPAGTYRVSDTLVKRYRTGNFGSGMMLQGEGPGRTIIRLADGAPRFDDPAHPRAIVMTTSKLLDASGNRDYVGKGEGNDAYANFVEGLTVDTGDGNPGAIGIDYLASNFGAIRDVVVQASPGNGVIGIAMLRAIPGPALIQTTQVKGFRTGIAISHAEYGMTLSDVALDDQAETGLSNDGNVISAERLTIAGSGKTGLKNTGAGSLVTLVEGSIEPAIQNTGTIVFRGTRAALPVHDAPAATLDGVLGPDASFHAHANALLPRVSIPTVDPGPTEAWVGVTGSTEEQPVDVTEALQRALNSGAHTIYLRHGTFWLSAPMQIPASVHRILGMGSTLRAFAGHAPGFPNGAPMLQVSQPGPPLEIDHLVVNNSKSGVDLAIRHSSSRSLLLRDFGSAGADVLHRTATGGPVALEDLACGPLLIEGPAPVTARQFNTEGGGIRIENKGAPFSIVGLKTEQENTVVATTDGGQTQILGGLVFIVNVPSAQGLPLFIDRSGSLDASFVETVLVRGRGYRVYLRQEDAGRIKEIDAESMPARGFGHVVGDLSAGPHWQH